MTGAACKTIIDSQKRLARQCLPLREETSTKILKSFATAGILNDLDPDTAQKLGVILCWPGSWSEAQHRFVEELIDSYV